jgi:hypothetical protein
LTIDDNLECKLGTRTRLPFHNQIFRRLRRCQAPKEPLPFFQVGTVLLLPPILNSPTKPPRNTLPFYPQSSPSVSKHICYTYFNQLDATLGTHSKQGKRSNEQVGLTKQVDIYPVGVHFSALPLIQTKLTQLLTHKLLNHHNYINKTNLTLFNRSTITHCVLGAIKLVI